jgi:hypothetical protein
MIAKRSGAPTLQSACRGFTLKQRIRSGGFTLAELLVSIFVLVIIIFMVAQLMTSAAVITRTGHKHVDTDTQARVVFDRMALDFAQMLKRIDVDYFVKGPANYNNHGHGGGHGWGHGLGTNQQGSDQIAFFSHVPGYYPSGAQSPISLVAYRVNQRNSSTNPFYLKLERMAKGLHWAGVADNQDATNQNAICPILFLPQTIEAVQPWYAAVNNGNSCGGGNNNNCDADYEVIGPGVFRFEYYYLLKNGRLTDVPWDRLDWPTRQSLGNDPDPIANPNIGLNDVEAIGVTIAVIDPAGRKLIDAANPNSLLDLASDLDDFVSAHGRGIGNQTRYIGMMEADWKGVLFGDAANGVPGIVNTGATSAGTPVPPEAAKAIRVYTRYFDLKSL